jgi:hypothetical protein
MIVLHTVHAHCRRLRIDLFPLCVEGFYFVIWLLSVLRH